MWGGGWLAQLGANYGLGQGFLDSGGAATIQVVGGLTALSMVWILGPRLNKYSPEGMPAGIPGHSLVFVVFGCFLAWLGWLGLNSAGALLFNHVAPGRVVLVAVNTTLSAAAAGLMAVTITRIRFGRPDASISANGWVGGLVASSAAAAFLKPAASLLIGFVAGILVTFAVEWFEMWLKVDDPGGAIPVHAVAGLWGLLAAGLFARFPGQSSADGQWLAQVIGIATLLGFVLPLTYSLNWLLDRFYRAAGRCRGRAARHGSPRTGRRRLSGIRVPHRRVYSTIDLRGDPPQLCRATHNSKPKTTTGISASAT